MQFCHLLSGHGKFQPSQPRESRVEILLGLGFGLLFLGALKNTAFGGSCLGGLLAFLWVARS
jgi:hypothetical protein